MSIPPSESDQNKPKSLWGVMGEQEESADEQEAATKDAAEKTASSGGKGLWGVMGQPKEDVTTNKDDSTAETTEPAAKKGKGLWGVIESAPSVEEKEVEKKEVAPPLEPAPVPPPIQSNHEPGSFADILFRAEQDSEVTSQAHQIRQRQSGKSWYGLGSIISGVLACLLSTLSLLPDIYWKIPASFIGLIAVVLGLLAMDELRRRDIPRLKILLPLLGLLFGIFAMFAGPLIFTPWGDKLRATEIQEESPSAEDDETSVDISVGE